MQRALSALEELGGVSGAAPQLGTQKERAKSFARRLIDDEDFRALVNARLNELGLTGLVLRPRPLAVLKRRLTQEVKSVLLAQVPDVAGISALDVVGSGKPLGPTVRGLLRERANLILGQLVVSGDPIRGFVLKLVKLDKVIARASDKAVKVATWPAQQVARLIRGLGRKGLTLEARARRSTRGLLSTARRIRCRIRPTAATKVDGKRCKGIRHGATLRDVLGLIRQAERRLGASLRLERDLNAAGQTALLAKHKAARAALRRAGEAALKAFLLDTPLAQTEDNVKVACAELERLDRIIAELEKKIAAPTPPPPPPPAVEPGGAATVADCPTGTFDVTISPGGPGQMVPDTQIQRSATHVSCNYKEKDGKFNAKSSIEITWTPGGSSARPQQGCGPGASGAVPVGGSWLSSLRKVQAAWVNKSITLVNPNEQTLVGGLVTALEQRGVGGSCFSTT